MRFLFHGILGLAVGIVTTGIVCGGVARARMAAEGASPHASIHPVTHQRLTAELAVAPPVPLFPRYAERVSPGATLAWHLGDDLDGARLELSRTATFDASTTTAADVGGDRFRLPPSLPGGIWYWRLRGRANGVVGERTTPTWMLSIVASPAPEWG